MAAAERKEILDIPLEKLFAVISDYASYPNFVTGMKDAKFVEDKGEAKVFFFDMEMVKRVNYKIKITSKLAANKDRVEVDWSLVESSFFKGNNGSWRLKAISPTQTEATYKLELDFNFPVPGFVLKGMIASNLPNAMKEFLNEAKKRG